ncbi:MAG: hypothetical protein QOF00_5801 [Pseudonocardiales bacterium]|nr:hypothetical protein [Pseudonocardiales bacterium]
MGERENGVGDGGPAPEGAGGRRGELVEARASTSVSTRLTKNEATEANRDRSRPAAVARALEIGVHNGGVALQEKINVTLTLMPSAKHGAIAATRPRSRGS